MRITRRGLFATLAAAVIGKPAVKGVSLALIRAYDPRPWYPVPNSVLTKDEITHKSLMILQQKALINPES